jgi:hypothetical protein
VVIASDGEAVYRVGVNLLMSVGLMSIGQFSIGQILIEQWVD